MKDSIGQIFCKNLILSEDEESKGKRVKMSERKSYELFQKCFPEADATTFTELYNLIKADLAFNENNQ
jgi:hypothetical protein